MDELPAGGPARLRTETLLLEAARAIVSNRLIVDGAVWHRNSANDAFAMAFLRDLFGARTWDTAKLLGSPAIPFFRETNRRGHTYASTRGAANFKKSVAQAQGGLYCCLCGSREQDLVVDHIQPVNQGGDPTSARNMQLLCAACNTAKGALADDLIPTALRLSLTRHIPPTLRFKVLLISAQRREGRYVGRCDCGSVVPSTRLEVRIAPKYSAANFANLVIVCERCNA